MKHNSFINCPMNYFCHRAIWIVWVELFELVFFSATWNVIAKEKKKWFDIKSMDGVKKMCLFIHLCTVHSLPVDFLGIDFRFCDHQHIKLFHTNVVLIPFMYWIDRQCQCYCFPISHHPLHTSPWLPWLSSPSLTIRHQTFMRQISVCLRMDCNCMTNIVYSND